jgi:hypothetical protein
MTAPRIISAAEARALLEAATPGPWTHNWRDLADGAPGDLWHTRGCGGPLTTLADWELAARAPDLAASVVALHDRAEQAAAERALLDEAFTVITDGQVDADWEGWCARVVRVLETIKVTP